MSLLFCLAAFAGAFLMSQRRLGHGLGYVLAVGCIYGWLRANFLDGLTHFAFDAALVGLYLSVLPRLRFPKSGAKGWLWNWTALLLVWPVVVILLSPLLDAQHLLVQLVGLRNAVLFLPLLLVASVVQDDDLRALGTWAEWCVVGVSCFAALEVIFGLELFFPVNSVTEVLYTSNDIAGGFNRIPACFLSAHAYGGTMVALLPLLLTRLETTESRRPLTVIATGLSSIGVFACGARLPVVIFALVAGSALLGARRRPTALVLLFVIMAAVGYTVSRSERLRRFETLADAEMVEERIAGSVNVTFLEILIQYPMGKGLGSAAGTSIPFFLAEYARPPVGIESEYGRILLEEGLIGLFLWVSFLLSLLGQSAFKMARSGATREMWVVCVGFWASGLIGCGILASIPATMLLMFYMGRLAVQRSASRSLRFGGHAPSRIEVLGLP